MHFEPTMPLNRQLVALIKAAGFEHALNGVLGAGKSFLINRAVGNIVPDGMDAAHHEMLAEHALDHGFSAIHPALRPVDTALAPVRQAGGYLMNKAVEGFKGTAYGALNAKERLFNQPQTLRPIGQAEPNPMPAQTPAVPPPPQVGQRIFANDVQPGSTQAAAAGAQGTNPAGQPAPRPPTPMPKPPTPPPKPMMPPGMPAAAAMAMARPMPAVRPPAALMRRF